MNASARDTKRILEHLALQRAADSARHSADYGSRICRLPAGSWQADIIRRNDAMPQARDPAEFRRAMKDPARPIIFLSREAVVTWDVIERICAENPLNKMVIWETD
jgi:hypothetical protein